MFSRMSSTSCSRMIAKLRVLSQPLPQNRSLHVSHRFKDVNSKIYCLGYYPAHSSVFNTNFVRSASTTEATTVPAPDALPQIPDAPIPVVPDVSEIIGEPTLESIGLGGYSPIGLTQKLLFFIHSSCGLPWWTTIILGTVAVKILTFPMYLKMQRHQALTQVYKKDLDYFERKKKEALDEEDQMKVQLYAGKQEQFYQTKKMLTMKGTLINYSIQGSVFFTFFMALNGMARAPVISMKEGGFLWFTDITMPDPYYALPFLSAATTALFLHLSPPPAIGTNLTGYKKYLKFVIPVITFPIMIYFKAAVLFYFMTSTWLTFLSHALIRIPKFKAFCKIPVVKHDSKIVSMEELSVREVGSTFKTAWGDFKRSRAYGAAFNIDQSKFESAARGPLVKTYKFDPTKTKIATNRMKIAK